MRLLGRTRKVGYRDGGRVDRRGIKYASIELDCGDLELSLDICWSE